MTFFIQMPKLTGTNCCFCISDGNVWADSINDYAVDFIADWRCDSFDGIYRY